MTVSYDLRNYWCASRLVSRLSPRVAARYLEPRIIWAVDRRERSLMERLRDRALREDRLTMIDAHVLPLRRAEADPAA